MISFTVNAAFCGIVALFIGMTGFSTITADFEGFGLATCLDKVIRGITTKQWRR